jgi:hypothetical protein
MFAKFTPRLISTCYTAAVTACYQSSLRFELWLEDFRQNIIFSVDPQFPPAQPQRKKRWRIHNRRKQQRSKQTEIKLVNEMILAAFARPQTPTPSLPPSLTPGDDGFLKTGKHVHGNDHNKYITNNKITKLQ